MPPLFLVILVVVPFLCGAVAVFLAFVIFGPRTIKHFGHRLKWVRCESCTAGAQWYNAKSGWGPIPVHIRMVSELSPHFEAPQANIRQCTNCRGMGGFWVDRENELREESSQDSEQR